jgi:hypothetical protein
MNTKPLTLTEVSKLVEELSIEGAMTDERIMQFIESVEHSGKDLLSERGGTEYVKDAADLVFSSVIVEFMNANDYEFAVNMMMNAQTFKRLCAIAFIYSVGISVVEELH